MEGWSDGVLINVLVQLSATWCNPVQRNGMLNSNTPMLHNSNTPFHLSLAVVCAAHWCKWRGWHLCA